MVTRTIFHHSRPEFLKHNYLIWFCKIDFNFFNLFFQVLFSNCDNERSIPCVVDGFKPGQRKVMFTCLKRNDKREVKVITYLLLEIKTFGLVLDSSYGAVGFMLRSPASASYLALLIWGHSLNLIRSTRVFFRLLNNFY